MGGSRRQGWFAYVLLLKKKCLIYVDSLLSGELSYLSKVNAVGRSLAVPWLFPGCSLAVPWLLPGPSLAARWLPLKLSSVNTW